MISVADLIRYRLQTERFIQRQSEGCLHTEFGDFKTVVYASTIVPERHLALVHGEIAGKSDVLVRMHSHCIYGDVFGSTDCECHMLIRRSMERITEEGAGVLVYLHQTGPGFRVKTRPPMGHDAIMHLPAASSAVAARKRHRRADSFRSGPAHHPPADQPSAQDRGAGRLRHRDRGAGPGSVSPRIKAHASWLFRIF